MRRIALALFVLISIGFLPPPASAVTIDTVLVGNPDGVVDHPYRIGTYEVTNDQYTAFLNAKAASDPLSLYSTQMASNARSGITRSGADGSYTYAVKANMGNKPVNYVSWYDAIRFINWLHNGQGSGDTENGAYTLLGGTATPSNATTIARNSDARWFLPSEYEWFKAAYHQPVAQGGDSDNYWLYPTRSNSVPTMAHASSVGDISNPGANVANYGQAAVWNGQPGNVTTVGSAGPLSASYYGTFDQGGNVWEWCDQPYFRGPPFALPPSRLLHGGDFSGSADMMTATGGRLFTSADGYVTEGFRVAAIVCEPDSLVLAALGLVSASFLLRRSGARRKATPPIATNDPRP